MQRQKKKITKSILCILLSIMMALQGTEPIFVQAKEMIENAPRDVDFSKPEALTEEEVGMDTDSSGEKSKKKPRVGQNSRLKKAKRQPQKNRKQTNRKWN